MENQNQLDNIFNISFDDNSRESLRTIALWARICAVCAFVGYAIALILAFFGKVGLPDNSEGSSLINSFGRASLITGALISAIIGGAINYFLYRFAADAKEGLASVNQVKLNEGLINLKTYFKILGIILLIVLIICALALVIGIIGATLSRR
jgi:membrane protein YqaA with SNARE-associated domain